MIPRLLHRCVVLLLVPALLVDPTWASTAVFRSASFTVDPSFEMQAISPTRGFYATPRRDLNVRLTSRLFRRATAFLLSVNSFVGISGLMPAFFLTSSHKLFAQSLQIDPAVVDSAYNALLASRRPLTDVFQYLVREAARQQMEAESLERAGDHAGAQDHQRLSQNLSAVLRKALEEYPLQDGSGGRKAALKTLMDVLPQTTDATEQQLVLQAALSFMNQGQRIPDFDPTWARELIRALQHSTLESLSSEILKVWIMDDSNGVYVTKSVLRELALARLREDAATEGALESFVRTFVPAERLLRQLFFNGTDPVERDETLRQLSAKPSLPMINESEINISMLRSLLSDAATREATLNIVQGLISARLIVPSNDMVNPAVYDELTFDVDLHRFRLRDREQESSSGNIPPLEGQEHLSSVAAMLMMESLISRATGDTVWADRLRTAAAPLMTDPKAVLAFLSAATDFYGTDRAEFEKETVAAEALDAVPDAQLSRVVIHDPRLVAVLINMEFRRDTHVRESARRALRLVTVTHPEAMRVVSDEAEAARWADFSETDRQKVDRFVNLVVEAGGDWEKLQGAVASSNANLEFLQTVQRVREFADAKPNGIGEAMGLGSRYSDIFSLILSIQDALNEEENSDRRHAITSFLEILQDRIPYGSHFSVQTVVRFIDDLGLPANRTAAAHMLSRSDFIEHPLFMRLIWEKVRPLLRGVLASPNSDDMKPVSDLLSTLLNTGIYRDRRLFSFLVQENDPFVAAWLLGLIDQAGDSISEPSLAAWLGPRLDDGLMGPLARKMLLHDVNEKDEDSTARISAFRNEIVILNNRRLTDLTAELSPKAASVWIESLDEEAEAQAVSLLDTNAYVIQVQDPGKLLTAFLRSLDNTDPNQQAAAVRTAQRAVFPEGTPLRPWLEGLLSARIGASLRGQSTRAVEIDAVLDAALRNAAARRELLSLSAMSLDNRIREEATRQLSRPLARIPTQREFWRPLVMVALAVGASVVQMRFLSHTTSSMDLMGAHNAMGLFTLVPFGVPVTMLMSHLTLFDASYLSWSATILVSLVASSILFLIGRKYMPVVRLQTSPSQNEIHDYQIMSLKDKVIHAGFVALQTVMTIFLALEVFDQGWQIFNPTALFYFAAAVALGRGFFRWWIYAVNMKRPEIIEAPVPGTLRVAMVTTFVPGKEPLPVLENTLTSMLQVRYPHDSYILDEGNDSEVQRLVERLNTKYGSAERRLFYYTRPDKSIKQKGANLTAWLQDIGYASYDVATFLDVDHAPFSNYLDRTLGYLGKTRDGKQVVYVQAPAVAGNRAGRGGTFVSEAAEQWRQLAFSIRMPAYYGLGTPLMFGDHTTINLKALQTIGGYPMHHADDFLTAKRLQEQGYTGVYLAGEILARGIEPAYWDGFFMQQVKWAYGVTDIQVRHLMSGLRGLSLRQYLVWGMIGMNYIWHLLVIGGIILEIVYLFFQPPAVFNTLVLFFYLDIWALQWIADLWMQKFFTEYNSEGRQWLRLRWILASHAAWPSLVRGVLLALFRRDLPRQVTPKNGKPTFNINVFWPHLTVFSLIGAGEVYNYSWWGDFPYGITLPVLGLLIMGFNIFPVLHALYMRFGDAISPGRLVAQAA